ncbi:hypothetical protein BU15DRAFT_90800 [Melanogaster broomeanus]|nr:hypothetical protein BU15DRAFT_90800 [Melanogaster broomeanus]
MSSSSSSSSSESSSPPPPHSSQRQNSIWVGNLSFWTTQDALRAFFEGVGEITRIHMPAKPGKKGENMGFAYVDFATPDAKEGQLEGRNLLIKDGNDFKGRPAANVPGGAAQDKPSARWRRKSSTAQKILRVQKQPPAPTLFLGNLGFDTTESSIRQLFEAHRRYKHGGEKGKGKDVDAVWIRKVRMGTFEDSGACKGLSCTHSNHRLNGRSLVVEYASADAVPAWWRWSRNPKQVRGSGEKKQEEHGDNIEVEVEEKSTPRPRSQRPDRGGQDRSHKGRMRPGAALAEAPRQSGAIVPSQGQKIVF